EPSLTLRFSAAETLREKDFAEYSEVELRESQRLMHRLRLAGQPRRSMRFHSSRRRSSQHDLRRTVRASLANEGEPILRYWREPGKRLRRLVVLLDVSGSMEPYARALLRFMHSAVVGRQRVEAFAFGTRLTRITKELSNHDPDKALALASAQVPDWSGGTRLGESLRRFNDTWGVRGMARGAIVVVLSDGWDRGDPEILAEQMQRLKRVAYRVVWVNPLKVTPGYAPLARGMAAALPFVDHFVEGHSLASLEHLTDVISGNQLAGSEGKRRTHA
ncbi:MAG: VWA domain-containing protein, partial [Ilumatobacteraceae bacterium]